MGDQELSLLHFNLNNAKSLKDSKKPGSKHLAGKSHGDSNARSIISRIGAQLINVNGNIGASFIIILT